MNDSQSPQPVKEDQRLASYIAMVVRNAMQDFHCEHLTDDQMKQLNDLCVRDVARIQQVR